MSSFSRTGRSTNSIDWNESCDKHAVYFRRWLKWRAMFIAFWLSGNDFISLEWMSLISCIYTRVLNQFRNDIKSKYPKDYSTFDKVGRGAKAKNSKVSELTRYVF